MAKPTPFTRLRKARWLAIQARHLLRYHELEEVVAHLDEATFLVESSIRDNPELRKTPAYRDAYEALQKLLDELGLK